MGFEDLPNELIAHVSSYLSYTDICNLMESTTRNYDVIKRYRKDKMKQARIEARYSYGKLTFKVTTVLQKFSFLGFNKSDLSDYVIMKKLLTECLSIDFLLLYVDFTSELFELLMKTNAKIRNIKIQAQKLFITLDETLKLSQKFKMIFMLNQFQTSIWTDEVLSRMLPRSTVWRHCYLPKPISHIKHPELITNCTLNTLVANDEIQKTFGISCVDTSFTVEEIARVIKVLHQRNSTDVHWNLGRLHKDQHADAASYFGKKGKLREMCGVKIRHQYDETLPTIKHYVIESLVEGQFFIELAIDLDE